MARKKAISVATWLNNTGSFGKHDIKRLKAGLAAGYLNEVDEYGYSAVFGTVCSNWMEGLSTLLKAGADTEVRDYRTGETALYVAVLEKNEEAIALLLRYGANPDAGNHYGVTPRRWNPKRFAKIRKRPAERPAARIQNAEHLADHYWPRFKIPGRKERERLKPGQAVDLYVYGPKGKKKKDSFKVRISSRLGNGNNVRYQAILETPVNETHLPPGTTEVEFGPENVATVYVPHKAKAKPKKG